MYNNLEPSILSKLNENFQIQKVIYLVKGNYFSRKEKYNLVNQSYSKKTLFCPETAIDEVIIGFP